ncbi:hypothetical protein [Hydrogenoanaerobacterium sp.]|uniref:hypothetical protein n=1 Tax=Hydrogenoanaerobacterium sp. TaxID=2953763 RepID=UPI00289CB983|nr:hypothetical protein [Hydrogenoanaerobacterium sp.]
MELKNIFPDFNAMWIRWSAYEISDALNGRYIMPSTDATSLPYSSTENLQELLTDALNLGKAVYQKSDEVERECRAFVQKHGLLGLHKSDGSRVFPMKGGNISPARKEHSSQEYGEELSHFTAEFQKLYLHFLATRGELPEQLPKHLQSDLAMLTTQSIPSGLSYRLTAGFPPQMVWQPDDLIDVLRLAYGLAVTDTAAPLKVCKNCGTVYYNPHQKSEFCSVKCRNYFNVKVFREKR